jgi:DICT domain-containing protein
MSSLPSGTLTKRLLIDVSHALEQYALARAPAEPVVVIAMFQKLAYLMREVDVYRRIAETGAIVVVGIVEDYPPALPAGITHVLLRPDEDLAHEWSVTVLGPGGGSTLVCTDLQTVMPDAATLESGRQFDGGWSFLREHAYAETLRLRHSLAGRLDPRILQGIDQVLGHTAQTAVDGREQRANAALHLLTQRLSTELDRSAGLRNRVRSAGAGRHRTGLPDPSFLHRWLAGSTSGTLPLGLLHLRLHDLGELRASLGMRAEVALLRLVGDHLRQRLRGAERAVAVSDTDFLLLLPARDQADLSRLYTALLDDLDRAERHYPYVRLATSAAATVTRRRPLPDLSREITGAPDEQLTLVAG